jgi:hypothetical protein
MGLPIEGDNLKVRAVGERDQGVMTAHRMLAPSNDSEAEPFIVFGGLLEVADDNHDMIDLLKHEA